VLATFDLSYPFSLSKTPFLHELLSLLASVVAKMTPTLNNKAAWITDLKARPLKVGPGPEPNPSENEVVIKVGYAAVNPTDWKVRNSCSCGP
jgi:hypothetical protein